MDPRIQSALNQLEGTWAHVYLGRLLVRYLPQAMLLAAEAQRADEYTPPSNPVDQVTLEKNITELQDKLAVIIASIKAEEGKASGQFVIHNSFKRAQYYTELDTKFFGIVGLVQQSQETWVTLVSKELSFRKTAWLFYRQKQALEAELRNNKAVNRRLAARYRRKDSKLAEARRQHSELELEYETLQNQLLREEQATRDAQTGAENVQKRFDMAQADWKQEKRELIQKLEKSQVDLNAERGRQTVDPKVQQQLDTEIQKNQQLTDKLRELEDKLREEKRQHLTTKNEADQLKVECQNKDQQLKDQKTEFDIKLTTAEMRGSSSVDEVKRIYEANLSRLEKNIDEIKTERDQRSSGLDTSRERLHRTEMQAQQIQHDLDDCKDKHRALESRITELNNEKSDLQDRFQQEIQSAQSQRQQLFTKFVDYQANLQIILTDDPDAVDTEDLCLQEAKQLCKSLTQMSINLYEAQALAEKRQKTIDWNERAFSDLKKQSIKLDEDKSTAEANLRTYAANIEDLKQTITQLRDKHTVDLEDANTRICELIRARGEDQILKEDLQDQLRDREAEVEVKKSEVEGKRELATQWYDQYLHFKEEFQKLRDERRDLHVQANLDMFTDLQNELDELQLQKDKEVVALKDELAKAQSKLRSEGKDKLEARNAFVKLYKGVQRTIHGWLQCTDYFDTTDTALDVIHDPMQQFIDALDNRFEIIHYAWEIVVNDRQIAENLCHFNMTRVEDCIGKLKTEARERKENYEQLQSVRQQLSEAKALLDRNMELDMKYIK